MHCTNCGSYVAPGTRFCAGCGAPASDPEVTRLARTQGGSLPAPQDDSRDVGRVVFNARPTLLFVGLGYAAAALCAILLVILLALNPLVKVPWFIAIPLAMALLLIPAYYHLRRNMVRYTLTDTDIQIDQGLLARTTRNIPLRTIQDVTVSATVPQRLLGYGNVIIDNASDQGGHIVLGNIHDPRKHADLLLRELRRWR
jgi:membrane protein YdbS with pleckstrin-like domain